MMRVIGLLSVLLLLNHYILFATNGNTHSTRSIVFKNPMPAEEETEKDVLDEHCRKYKKGIITGSVCLGIGVGLVSGGAVLIDQGKELPQNETLYKHRLPGTIMIFAGASFTAVGIVLLARNADRHRKYCNNRSVSTLVNQNGVGLAFNF